MEKNINDVEGVGEVIVRVVVRVKFGIKGVVVVVVGLFVIIKVIEMDGILLDDEMEF